MTRDKPAIRERVWKLLERRRVGRFPFPLAGRIPNFRGAEAAAARAATLPEWKRARRLKCNPDAPQRPLRLRASDWLGFLSIERTVPVSLPIVAYPMPLATRDRHLSSLRPLAETAVRRGLLPDPLRFRGVREHRAGDPRKEIHWKASARLRLLQTKLYEPATSLDAVFLVNVASYEQYWIQADPDAVELVVSAAADLVRAAAAAGRQVGLVTNGIDNLTHERPRSALARGPRSLQRSLEILARLGPYAVNSPEAVFLAERGRLPWGATLIVVTPKIFSGLAGGMLALRRAHHRVLGVTIAPPAPEMLSHFAARGIVVDVLHPSELQRAV